MIRTAPLALIALVTVALAAVPAGAHEGHDHKILGTMRTATADRVTVEDRDGKEVTVQITGDTKVKSNPAVKVEDITPGTRVVITATMQKDKTLRAKTIEVGRAPGAAK